MYKALMIEDHKEVRDFVKEYFDHKEIEVQIPLFCHIDEEGISVTQGEASSSCKWSDLRKVVYRKNEMYLFTSAIYATIITRNSCEEKFDELVAFVKEKTKK